MSLNAPAAGCRPALKLTQLILVLVVVNRPADAGSVWNSHRKQLAADRKQTSGARLVWSTQEENFTPSGILQDELHVNTTAELNAYRDSTVR